MIDRQITAASTASSKKSRKRLAEPEPERNSKKQKVEHSDLKAVVRRAKVTITYGRADKRRTISLTPQSSPVQKSSSGQVKQEELVGDAGKVVLHTQPRANNGRFAKKSRLSNTSPVQKKETSPQKRRNDEIEDAEESPRKKPAHVDREDEEILPTVQKLIPRRSSGFHAGRLFSNPNPQQFALKTWSNMSVLDYSSEDDNPVTLEDNFSSLIDPAEAEMVNNFSLPRARASLSCINPSPHAFAKNRWNSFGQATTSPKSKLSSRRLSLDELYISEAEVSVQNLAA